MCEAAKDPSKVQRKQIKNEGKYITGIIYV